MSENEKCVVVYRSGSGFTKAYAQWIAEDLKCDLKEGKGVEASDLLKYDTIICGGGLYEGRIKGFKLIKKNLALFEGKKLIVFTVGASPVRSETTEELRNKNLPGELQERIQFFYLRGGFDYSRLTPFNKFLMSLMKIKLKSAKNPTADEKGLLASYSHPLDFTNKKYIQPIIESVRS